MNDNVIVGKPQPAGRTIIRYGAEQITMACAQRRLKYELEQMSRHVDVGAYIAASMHSHTFDSLCEHLLKARAELHQLKIDAARTH